MIDRLKEIDRELFLFLNSLHHPWLDQLMYYMSEKLFWIPVYLLFMFLIVRVHGMRTMLWSVLGVALVITLADRISVELFKNVFVRYRPSRNLEIGELIHIVNDYRGGLYGFVSSHAANFFGVATFIFMLLRKAYAKWAWLIFVWAALISYTRIYLGVHYPADILAGGLLGMLIGWVVYLLMNRFIINKTA